MADFPRVLCVAAHPDDEVLGAGALIAQAVDAGSEALVLLLGEGVGARYPDNARPDSSVATVASQAQAAAAVLGASLIQLDFPDNRFDSLDLLDVVKAVEGITLEFDPDLVLTHHAGDLNVDHRVASNAVLTAFRPVPGKRPRTILGFETLSSTEWGAQPGHVGFAPNWFVDATDGLERKIEAMRAYEHELCDWPHPRSLEGIETAARRWGMTIGVESAEAYMLLRRVC